VINFGHLRDWKGVPKGTEFSVKNSALQQSDHTWHNNMSAMRKFLNVKPTPTHRSRVRWPRIFWHLHLHDLPLWKSGTTTQRNQMTNSKCRLHPNQMARNFFIAICCYTETTPAGTADLTARWPISGRRWVHVVDPTHCKELVLPQAKLFHMLCSSSMRFGKLADCSQLMKCYFHSITYLIQWAWLMLYWDLPLFRVFLENSL